MANTNIVRGKTLPDAGVKNDLHELIDLSTVSISNIVNADIDNSAAIAGSKISPNFGGQNITCDDITSTGNVAISGTTDLGNDFTVTGDATITGDVTINGDCQIFGAWDTSTYSEDTVYQASTDGIVCARATDTSTTVFFLQGITDGNASPTRVVASYNLAPGTTMTEYTPSVVFPVRKGDYWKVQPRGGYDSATVYWLPIG